MFFTNSWLACSWRWKYKNKFLIQQKVQQDFKTFLLVRQGLAPITVSNHLRAAGRMLNSTGRLFPSQDLAFGYLAGLRDKNASFSHIKNTTRAVWWYFKFLGCDLAVAYPKKPKTQVQEILTVTEIKKLLSACVALHDKTLISLLACTGLRTKELRNLKVRDTDTKNLVLFVVQGKNLTDRNICITQTCAHLLNAFVRNNHKLADDYIFGNGNNQPISLEYLRSLFKLLRVKTKIPKKLHVHLFRHSLATNLLLGGADILTVQRQLGHKDPRTTLAYISYTDKIFKKQYQKYMPSY